METFCKGYKFPNGVPMSDQLKPTLDSFIEYAQAQGDTRSRDEFLDYFGKLIGDTVDFPTQNLKE